MLNTLLFDLDGTLLPFDHEAFMKSYFERLLPEISQFLEPKRAVSEIWAATKAMVENEAPDRTNLEVFKESFCGSTGVKESDIWPLFDAFYAGSFNRLQEITEPSTISREICQTAVDKGYQLVLATNPIFPSEAVQHRMRWAGIHEVPFKLITTMEHMHYCKPNPKYYVEILDMVRVKPNEAMMFGNDVQEDGVAGMLGMQTFLVNDFIIDRGLGHVEFTHQGTLADALQLIRELPAVGS
jgi:FMN phosphatase YigB (HAD superfamily)